MKAAGKTLLVIAVLAAAVYASTKAGTPKELPGVAMDWEALFHVERAGALLGAAGVVLLIGWRALAGEFPIKFGNVEYAVEDAAADAKQATAAQEQRIRVLEVLAGIRDPDDLDDAS
jgi:hypothetical protein